MLSGKRTESKGDLKRVVIMSMIKRGQHDANLYKKLEQEARDRSANRKGKKRSESRANAPQHSVKELSKHEPKPSLELNQMSDKHERSINLELTSPSFHAKAEIKRQKSVTSVKAIKPLVPNHLKSDTEASQKKDFFSEIDSGFKTVC